MADTLREALHAIEHAPRDPPNYRPEIGLVGCGDISEFHLQAYRAAGYNVVGLCDIDLERAEARREEFFPDAAVYRDHQALLDQRDLAVVDVALHPEHRIPVIEDAIRAGTHVLSQKPFVLDLEVGERLVSMAGEAGVHVAVNQNGRWAPHFSFPRAVVREDLIGEVQAVHFAMHWDYNWIADGPFEDRRHAIHCDYAIHWYDALHTLLDDPLRVAASMTRSPTQRPDPPLLGEALVEYDGAQATLSFDGDTREAPSHRTTIVGTDGTIVTEGPPYEAEEITVTVAGASVSVVPDGDWFPDGFHGSMAALLTAIAADEEPENSARDNLGSLALSFAAAASADDHSFVRPGSVTAVPE